MKKLADEMRDVLPVYEIPDDDLVGDVLIPAFEVCDEVLVAAGFFSSHCLAQLAPGLADYVARPNGMLRILLSPEISQEDHEAISQGIHSPEEVIQKFVDRALGESIVTPAALVEHTLDCLAYLVSTGRLELRFVLMERGMYHKKQWLFRQDDVWMAVHGSGNATARGLLVNGEQMTIDRPWSDGMSATSRITRLLEQWRRQWSNEHRHSLTLSAPQGLPFARRSKTDDKVPTVRDFWEAWRIDNAAGLEPEVPFGKSLAPRRLTIPTSVEWRQGQYGHQGHAVDAYFAAGERGVLAIATGGGKTKTALIAAAQAQELHGGHLVVVILVPSRPLMLQWAEEVRLFGISPFLPSLAKGRQRRAQVEEIRAALLSEQPRTEVVITTNALFGRDESLRSLIDGLSANVRAMLIGDEMHNLGVPTFVNDPPLRFESRLGLSATPIRQYDPDGTDSLFGYFGPQIFEFTLAEAIQAGCLTPYRYELHEVALSASEMDKYTELTEELRAAGFALDDNGQTVVTNPKIEHILRERRAVLEQAAGKIEALRKILIQQRPADIRRTLIYNSAKAMVLEPRRQIDLVNEMLSELGIISHQFTSAQTSRANAGQLLDRFAQGDYQVLTAMKVLDEGIDIPQTDTAHILASSTVRREWVQRRGRILRRAPGKAFATVHDYVVVPPDPSSRDGRAVLRGELRRAEEFTAISSNEWAPGGPRAAITRLEELM